MSKTVDQRVVEMRFDNSQFEKGINESISSLDKLKASLNFNNLMPSSSLSSISNSLNTLNGSVDNISSKFTAMGVAAATAIAKISGGVMDLANNAIQSLMANAEAGYGRYNEMMGAVQTIMYATRSQWDDTGAQMDYVTDKIDKLNWYTDETSYNLSDMTNSIGKFVSAGVDLDDAVTAMEGISSWAAISGQNAEKASYAMYNLSQAMAVGKLTVADWKSIENANMATSEFKQTAIDTAVALGKLDEQWDDDIGNYRYFFTKYGQYEWWQDGAKEVTAENLRTTLQYGWFDKDVITATLKKYGDFADELYKSVSDIGVSTTEYLGYLEEYEEALANGEDMDKWVRQLASKEKINNVVALSESLEKLSGSYYELGKASFKAAQESKTFEDSINYTKDALTTLWMNIFQDIFGNYLESKALWTDVSELMYEQMVAPLEEIEEQFASWNRMGGADLLKDSFWNFYKVFSTIKDAIKEGWEEILPNNLGRELLYIFQDIFNFSEKIQLKNRVVFSDYNNIKDAVASLGRVFLDFKISFGIISRAIKDAWARIFPSKEITSVVETFGFKIKKFGEWLEELSDKFKLTEEDGEKLERTFAGLFAVLDIGRLLLIAIIEPFTNFNTEIGEVSHGIFDVTASIGDWLVALRDFIRDHNVFGKTVTNVINIIKQIPAFLDKVSQKIFGMGIGELLTEIGQTAAGLFLLLGGLFLDFESTMVRADEYMANSKFAIAWPFIKNLILGVKAAIDDLSNFFNKKGDESGEGVLSKFTNIWSKIKDFFNTIKINAKTVWNNVINFAATALEAIMGFFDSVKDEISDIFASTEDDSLTTGQKIKGIFSSIGEKISAVFSSDKVKNAWSALADFFGRLGTKIRDKLGQSKLGQWFIDLGDKLKEFFASIPEKAGEVWTKLKDFFGLAGTKLGEIWDSIPGWIDTAKTNIKEFFDSVKAKFLEIWDIIQPYVATFVNAMKQFAATIAEHWDEIWAAIVKFFTWLGENGKKVIDWIIETDWIAWWGKVKLWCENAWDSVRHFFEQLPDKAKQAFEDLTGVSWEDFLQDVSDKWEEVKNKVQDLWDKITDFCNDAPEKLNNFAKKAGFDSWASLWDNISTSVGEAWHNIKFFFGLEYPEWIENPPDFLTEHGITSDQLKEHYRSPFVRFVDDIFPDVKDFQKCIDELDTTHFKANIQVVLGLAALVAALFFLYKIFTSTRGLIDEIEGFRPFKSSGSMLIESIGETVETFKKVNAAAAIKLYADTFLEIAGALLMISVIPTGKLLLGVAALAFLFGALISTLKYMEESDMYKNNADEFDPGKLIKIATAFDMMAGVFVAIAASLWLIGTIPLQQLGPAVGALTWLFGAIIGVFVMFNYIGTPNTDTMKELALGVGMLSGVLVVIAYALRILDKMDIGSMIVGALALGGLFTAIVGALIITDKITTGAINSNNYIAFAEAVGMLSGALVIIAVALRILDGMDLLNMTVAALALGGLFTALVFSFVVIDKMQVKTQKLGYFAGAMVMLGVALIEMSIAMKVLHGMDFESLITSAGSLVVLIGILTGAMLLIDKFVSSEAKMLAFAATMGILGVAMIELSFALWILKDIDTKNLWMAVGALAALFAVLTIGGAIGSYIGPGMIMFATAFMLLGVGAMAAGLGLKLVADALERMAAIGVEGFTGIADGLTILSEAAPHIVDGFLEALMRMAEQAGPIVVAFFTGFANAVTDNKEAITNGIVNFWMILIDAFNRVVPNLIDSVAAAVNQIVNKIRDLLVKIARIINANKDLFTQALTNFFLIFAETFRNVSPEFVSAFGVFLHAILEMLQGLWPDIEAFLLMAGDTALLLLGQLVTGLIQILIDNGPLLLQLLEFLFEGTLGIIEKYTPMITNLAFNLLMDTLNQILDNIDDVVSVTTQIAIATINGFIEGITEQIPNIIDKGVEFVLALINGVAEGLDKHAADIKDAMDNLARAMLRAFLIFMGMNPDEASSTAERWVNIGKDIMESLIQGVSSMVTQCAEAIRDIAHAMTEAWTSEVDEHSPSKEFEKHGMYLDLGLVNGVEKNKPQVISATKKMADDALDTLSAAFKNIKDRMFGDFEFDPTITPVLDLSNVTEGANYINDLFSADRALALAGLDSDGINSMVTNQDALNSLLNKLNMPTGNSDQNQNGVVNNNTFNITGDDPQAIANEISNILQSQVERRDSVWE